LLKAIVRPRNVLRQFDPLITLGSAGAPRTSDAEVMACSDLRENWPNRKYGKMVRQFPQSWLGCLELISVKHPADQGLAKQIV
jgi:hypothetical protein